jgi:hypothetical protein
VLFSTQLANASNTTPFVTGDPRRNQWEGIWPNIDGFTVDVDGVSGGGNETTAWGVTTWSSIGFDAEHVPFDRPGRATVILERRDDRWLAVHTRASIGSQHAGTL